MHLILSLLIFLLFHKSTGYPQLCNGKNFDDHRYLYGQETVPCHVFRPGTCLVVSPKKVDVSVAQMECTYRYGGQLVVPRDQEDVLAITKKLYFHPNIPADYNTSKFIIGLIGNKNYGDLRVDASKYSNTLEPNFWNNVMMSPKDLRIQSSLYPFAEGQKKRLSSQNIDQPPVGTCIDKVIGLNPGTAEFEVLNGRDSNYYLCETPRWPKYKCPPGYLLDRSQIMCYKAYGGEWNYYEARHKCRIEKSVIAASRPVQINNMLYSAFLTYLLNEDTSIPKQVFHTSQMTRGSRHFCDDGSFCPYPCPNTPADGFSIMTVRKTGVRDNPYQTDTLCFNDYQSRRRYGVVCSVRPDQSKAQT